MDFLFVVQDAKYRFIGGKVFSRQTSTGYEDKNSTEKVHSVKHAQIIQDPLSLDSQSQLKGNWTTMFTGKKAEEEQHGGMLHERMSTKPSEVANSYQRKNILSNANVPS